MRTIVPVMIVLSLAISGAMIGGSGFEDVWGSPAPETDAAEDELDEQADGLNPNDNSPVEGPVNSDDSSIVGLVVDSLSSVVGLAASTAVLPATLTSMGFPTWFALPVGSVVYILAGVGVVQFATNRRWI